MSRIVAKILPLLGNKIVRSNIREGKFETAFIDRHHQAARWRDRYFITAFKRNTNDTVVGIYRELFISRPNTFHGKDYGPYNRAISVGHNEGWIFSEIDKRLQR